MFRNFLSTESGGVMLAPPLSFPEVLMSVELSQIEGGLDGFLLEYGP